MRKIIIILNIAFVLIFLAGIGSSLNNKETDFTTKRTQEWQIEINFAIEEGVSQTSIEYVTNSLERVPMNVLKAFNGDGWSVTLLKEIDFGSDNYDDDTTGLIDYIKKDIQIKATRDGQETAIILHEIGHYMDWSNDFISSENEFIVLFNKYKDGSYVEYEYNGIYAPKEEMLYATKNSRELFATICKDYIIAPEYLRNEYPDLYKYIKDIFDSYS